MKLYPISKTLDLEHNYYITKADNARFEAFENGDSELADLWEKEFEKLLELEKNLIYKDGCFYVESKFYLLACQCRDNYRFSHN